VLAAARSSLVTGNQEFSPRDYNESSDVEPEPEDAGPERDDVTGEVLDDDGEPKEQDQPKEQE
jgi:hypothetical protein